jgi:hydrogenase-4 component H
VQLSWIARGLRTGIVTTRYPSQPEPQPAEWRGRPLLRPERCDGCAACTAVCLPEALVADDHSVRLDYGRCIMCGLCVPACPSGALEITPDYELAVVSADNLRVRLDWSADDSR